MAHAFNTPSGVLIGILNSVEGAVIAKGVAMETKDL